MAKGFGGIILAGGRSTRLGRDKATEVLAGATLIQRTSEALAQVVDRLIVVCRPDQAPPPVAVPLPVRYLVDDLRGAGPLAGLLTGLRVSGDDRCFAVACDAPLLQAPLLEMLAEQVEGFDGAVPVDTSGLPQPLCAVYSRDCIPAIERRLAEGGRRVSSFFDLRRIRLVPREVWVRADAEGLSFVNVNTEADLARAAALLGAAQRGE